MLVSPRRFLQHYDAETRLTRQEARVRSFATILTTINYRVFTRKRANCILNDTEFLTQLNIRSRKANKYHAVINYLKHSGNYMNHLI